MGGLLQADADHRRAPGSSRPLALCGVPFFSGFFSKDEIIDNADHNGYKVFFIVGLIGAFMTTAYMTRATYLTFFGKARGAAAGEHHDEQRPRRRPRLGCPRPTTVDDVARRMPTTHEATTPRRARRTRRPRLARQAGVRHRRRRVADRCSWSRSSSWPSSRSSAATSTPRRSTSRSSPSGSSRRAASSSPSHRSRHVQVGQGDAVDRARLARLRVQPAAVQGGLRRGRLEVEGPHPAQQGARRRPPLPGQQVLPRRPLREGHRPRRRPPHRAGGATGSTRTCSTASSTPSARAVAARANGSTSNIDQGVVDGSRSTAAARPLAVRVAHCARCSQARSTSTERCCSVPQQSVRSYSSSSTSEDS